MNRRAGNEEGAVAVTVALLMVVLVLMLGFVVDLGMARFDRHATQTAADVAATAAIKSLDTDNPDAYKIACQAAVDYFLANTSDAGPLTGDPCAEFADSEFTCSSTPPATTALALADPYAMVITIPVLDDDALMAGQDLNREVDGYDPCGRVGVRIERDRDYLFAGIVPGLDGARPASDAVGRISADGMQPEYATLVILDPHGCPVISGDGPIKLLVENLEEDVDGDGDSEFFPGIMTLDSDGADDPGCHLINPNGEDGRICAGVDPAKVGDILTNGALCESTPDTLLTESDPAQVARPDDLNDGRVAPAPIRRGRITRQPIDHRYNCRDDYYTPEYTNTQGRRHYPIDEPGDTDVQACGSTGTRRAHVDDLVAAYGDKSAADFASPPWTIINECTSSASVTYPAGNYFVNCGGNKGYTVSNGHVVTFAGPGTVVFKGQVQVKGTLEVNTAGSAAGQDSIVFVQDGGIADTGGTATRFYRTFVYLENGVITLQNSVHWEAPRNTAYDVVDEDGNVVESGMCTYAAGAPDAPCFKNLAAWSNHSDTHDLAAQAGIVLDGIFFAPNAGGPNGKPNSSFKLHGGPGYGLEHAQFFTYQLRLTGGSELTMRPDPDRFEATPVVGGGLIR